MGILRKKPVKVEIQERIVKDVWKRGNVTYTQYETPQGEYAGTIIVASNVKLRRVPPPSIRLYRDRYGVLHRIFGVDVEKK